MNKSSKTVKYHKLTVTRELIGNDNYEMIKNDLWSDDTSKIRIMEAR